MNISTAAFITLGMVLAAPSARATPAVPSHLKAEDYSEIEQLYAQYNIAVDTGNGESFANTFTPEGGFNSVVGHDALVAFIGMWRDKMHGADRRHWNSNLRIIQSPEGARGSVSLMLLDTSTVPASILKTGMYEDTLVKTEAGWRFKQRTVKFDAPSAAAASPAPAPPSAPAKP